MGAFSFNVGWVLGLEVGLPLPDPPRCAALVPLSRSFPLGCFSVHVSGECVSCGVQQGTLTPV